MSLLHKCFFLAYTCVCTCTLYVYVVWLPKADGGRSRKELYSNGSWSRTCPDSKSGVYAGGGGWEEVWGGEDWDLVGGDDR